jgi:hypothetical protein
MRGIAARLTSVPSVNGSSESQPDGDASSASVKSQLDELRASVETRLGAVQGLVEQIAAQPAPGGPILRAVDKTLGLAAPASALDASAPPSVPDSITQEQFTAAVRMLQRSGALSGQDAQVSAAAALLQQQMRGR